MVARAVRSLTSLARFRGSAWASPARRARVPSRVPLRLAARGVKNPSRSRLCASLARSSVNTLTIASASASGGRLSLAKARRLPRGLVTQRRTRHPPSERLRDGALDTRSPAGRRARGVARWLCPRTSRRVASLEKNSSRREVALQPSSAREALVGHVSTARATASATDGALPGTRNATDPAAPARAIASHVSKRREVSFHLLRAASGRMASVARRSRRRASVGSNPDARRPRRPSPGWPPGRVCPDATPG